jgi:hypothetical protein
MSYNFVLDAFFSYWYINLGVLAVLMLISLLFRRMIYTRPAKLFFNIFFVGIPFIWLLTFLLFNPMFLGYGHPAGVDGMMSAEGKIYVVDYILTGGSRVSGPAEYSRVHVLDAGTGSKILRFPAGEHCALFGVKGDSLIFYGENLLSIFSASNGKLIAKLNRKTLPGVFPELSSGIENVMISYSEKMLELTTVDGNHYNLSLQTASLLPGNRNKEKDEYSPPKNIYLQNDNEIKSYDRHGGKTLLQLQGKDGNQEARYLKSGNGNVVNELKFLMGEFIAVSESQKCFVVMSFETIKKTGFILTGISLDGQNKLWELKQSTLRPDDDMKYPLPTSWNLNSNSDVLYFAMKDEVMAMEILSGNILWRQKL